MDFTSAFLLTVVIAVAAKTAAWVWQLRTRNAGMVDAIWAWTLGGLAVVYALAGDGPPALRGLVALMGAAWGARLGWHLWQRNHGKPEDWRYAHFRKQWGASTASRPRFFASTVSAADFNMFWFFQFQNVFTLILAASAFAPAAYRQDMPSFFALAIAVLLWIGSILGEAVADRQMERFRADPANRGQVCRDGLWRYSRHPNYFFECLHWAAYVPLALGAPYGWVALAAPAVMAFLLLKLSGMPMLEAEMVRRKPGYAEYMRCTSALIPWPPRRA